MSIYALSDPHLSFSVPDKKMNRFGDSWVNHPTTIKKKWLEKITEKDIVVVPGDVSWATKLQDALVDLAWFEALPGRKVFLRGNHDMWWPSLKKLHDLPFSSLFFLHYNALQIDDFCFFGSRLWDTSEYTNISKVKWKDFPPLPLSDEEIEVQDKIYNKEILRLTQSIENLQAFKHLQSVGLCHYPPLGADMKESRASQLFESTNTEHVIFGHLHSVVEGVHYGKREHVEYHLTACDYINFDPKEIYKF